MKRFIKIYLDLASIYNLKKLKVLNFYIAMVIYFSKINIKVVLAVAIDMLMEYYLLVIKNLPLIISTTIIQISLLIINF